MLRKLLLPLLAAISFSFMSYHLAKAHREIPPQEPPVAPSRSPYNGTLAGAGIVEPQSENIAVGAHVAGVVTEVSVKVGQRVAQGEPLFQIDSRQQEAELATRVAQLDASRAELRRLKQMPRREDLPVSAANLEKTRADLKAQHDLLNRGEELFAKKVLNAEELVQRQQSYAAARALVLRAEAEDARLKAGAWEEDITVAEAQVERNESLVQQTRVEIDRLQVKAPIEGTILKVDVRPGEFVGAPPGQPLIVLGNTDTLHLRIDIDEQDLPRFRTGLPGRGYVRGDATNPVSLSFVRVEPYVQPKKSLTGSGTERVDTRVLQLIYAIQPTDQSIYVGQQFDVYLDRETTIAEESRTRK